MNMKSKARGSKSVSLRRIARRHRATPAETQARNCKVRVTMYLDADIVEYFKNRSFLPTAAPYQTQINAALRALLDGRSNSGEYASLLDDDSFIASKTLAEIYAAQGAFAEAVLTYQILKRKKAQNGDEYDQRISELELKLGANTISALAK